MLFTGYYEPVLKGASRKKPITIVIPSIASPTTRLLSNSANSGKNTETSAWSAASRTASCFPISLAKEIDGAGVLENKGLEIAWFADPVDIFFLHIQGSGMICLPDEKCFQVSYAQSNGRAYRSIGKLLIDSGKATRENLSMQGIKKYLRDHPEEAQEILHYNESYVFFRTVEEGPVGSIGVALTGGRSIATDQTIFPRGALAFIKTRKPVIGPGGDIRSWVPFSRFVLNQDTGGAITGPGRVDLFCGRGPRGRDCGRSPQGRGRAVFSRPEKSKKMTRLRDDAEPGEFSARASSALKVIRFSAGKGLDVVNI